MAYTLPPLPYDYAALEPTIDAKTMEIHHTKHHQAYIDKVNAAIAGTPLENLSIEELIADLGSVPEEKRNVVRNNGGGHANHSLFWKVLGPNGGGEPTGALAESINAAFGSFSAFKEKLEAAGANQFGSGWAWLILNKQGQLAVTSTPNQDSPIMNGETPLFGVDVWEHAYYLNYQNKRPAYLGAIWNAVNWNAVAENFANATK